MAAVLPQGWTRPVAFTQPPPAIPAEQLLLFPRTTLFEFPTPPGLDLYKYVQADNGRKYYLKLDRSNRYIRASEWLCYRLANLVGIATPRCDFIQTENGDIAFGSEDIGGVASRAETVRFLQTHSMNELGQPVPGLQAALSAIHVFDIFVNNIDRHHGNFLVRGTGDERQLFALDYARSMFWNWPLSGFPASNENTGETWTEIRDRHGFDEAAAILIVDRLGIINEAQISSILQQMPEHWLPEAIRNEAAAYCRDGGWAARVSELRRGLLNGSVV